MGDRSIMSLARRQAKPDREPLCVENDVDLGRKPAARATETVICTPFCRRGLLVGANGGAVDHLDVTVIWRR